jgi:hypothetical protein
MGNVIGRILGLAAAVGIAAAAFGCSDSKVYTSLEDAFLDYDEIETVNFSVSGEGVCPSCSAEARFAGMEVNLYLKEDPLHDVAIVMFDEPGFFSIDNIEVVKETTMVARGRLYSATSIDTPSIQAYTEFPVPDDDGDTVDITLTFPSSAPE